MTDLPLFSYRAPKDEPPRYRPRRDPLTSKLAADDLVASGRIHEQRAFVLGVIKAWGGQTALEYDREFKLDRIFNRRLSELRRLGLVENGDARPCRISGKRALTWRAVAAK